MARRGARQVTSDGPPPPPDRRPHPDTRRRPDRAEPTPSERVIDEPASRRSSARAPVPRRRTAPVGGRPADGTSRRRPTPSPRGDRAKKPPRTPDPLARDLGAVLGPAQAARARRRVVDAASALDADRPGDALRLLRPLLDRAPGVAAVRELAGLACYRMGRWSLAVNHLEAFVTLTGSVEQHPVLADAYRALGRPAKVEELWSELRTASPSAALVTEGRIVAAGMRADQGRLPEAIALLEGGRRRTRRPIPEHELRRLYALADLYERAGDAPRARELFTSVVEGDPSLADAAERLQALR